MYKIQAFGNFYRNWNLLETSKDMITICEDTMLSQDIVWFILAWPNLIRMPNSYLTGLLNTGVGGTIFYVYFMFFPDLLVDFVW